MVEFWQEPNLLGAIVFWGWMLAALIILTVKGKYDEQK